MNLDIDRPGPGAKIVARLSSETRGRSREQPVSADAVPEVGSPPFTCLLPRA